MKNKIMAVQDWLEYKMRLLCGKIAIEYRLPTILIMLAFFSGTSIYLFISSIYHIGKHDGEKEMQQVKHIRQLELESKKDSVLFSEKKIELPESQ